MERGHPWHDVPLGDPSKILSVVIEIPCGSKHKYELDLPTGLLRLKKTLLSPTRYPGNYGLVPRTIAMDGDPLDAVVWSQEPIAPMTIVPARVLGGFMVNDKRCEEEKLVCVLANDPMFGDCRDRDDMPNGLVAEMLRFFEEYKTLEGKKVKVGNVFGRERAIRVVHKSAAVYERQHPCQT